MKYLVISNGIDETIPFRNARTIGRIACRAIADMLGTTLPSWKTYFRLERPIHRAVLYLEDRGLPSRHFLTRQAAIFVLKRGVSRIISPRDVGAYVTYQFNLREPHIGRRLSGRAFLIIARKVDIELHSRTAEGCGQGKDEQRELVGCFHGEGVGGEGDGVDTERLMPPGVVKEVCLIIRFSMENVLAPDG